MIERALFEVAAIGAMDAIMLTPCLGINHRRERYARAKMFGRPRVFLLSGASLTKTFIAGGSIALLRPLATACTCRDCGVMPSTCGSSNNTFVGVEGPSSSRGASSRGVHSIVSNGSERYIVAARKLMAGEVVFDRMGGRVLDFSTRHSIQVGERQHLDLDNDMALTNHSCAPNCRIEIVNDGSPDQEPCISLIVRAAEIQEGELITLDYNAMELDMSDPFDCLCGAPRCRGRISGFSKLAPDIQAEYITGCPASGVEERSAGAAPGLPPLTPVVKAWLDAARKNLC